MQAVAKINCQHQMIIHGFLVLIHPDLSCVKAIQWLLLLLWLCLCMFQANTGLFGMFDSIVWCWLLPSSNTSECHELGAYSWSLYVYGFSTWCLLGQCFLLCSHGILQFWWEGIYLLLFNAAKSIEVNVKCWTFCCITCLSPLSFLQVGCPSCCPANSVNALKAFK